MRKVNEWIRNHKEETADAVCLFGFAVIVTMFFFGREMAAAICGIGALLGIAANVTA
ncbi:MAG: hypothetical protein IJL03_04210 [Lachnospiraceae bacterium]|nr:hypothetical protein [Lachnospiraceae bacterium]